MAASYDRGVGIDRLKDHYKHCIRLSASNKINPKNAFDLQLIDYMQDLVSNDEDGQMNFKIASSALDVGAKIYSNRVDRIQSEAQKVASSILMALDGQGTGKHQSIDDDDDGDGANVSGSSDRMNETNDDEDGSGHTREKDKKKISRKKNVKTVVEDEESLNAKLDKIILGDPFLDGLSRDFDMSCPAALICYNALTQPSCLLTIESSNLRKNYMEFDPKIIASPPSPELELPPIVEEAGGPTDNDGDVMMEEEVPASSNQDLNSKSQYDFVTLVTKKANCAQIIRNNQSNQICPRLESFLFNDRSTTLTGTNLNDDSFGAPNSSQGRVWINKTSAGGVHEFNPEHYGGNQEPDDYGDDHFGGDGFSVMGDNANDVNENDDLIPDLDKIAASKPTEYGYTTNDQHRLVNTWAGPYAWKVLKPNQIGKKDAPKSTKKRAKAEPMPINFCEPADPIGEKLADKEIRFSADVIKKWKKPLLPQDHNLNEDKVRKTNITAFLRPEDTYHCSKVPSEALKAVGKDHNYSKNERADDSDGGFASPAMGGFDDMHDDSDIEFRADPVVDGQEVAIYGAPINNTLAQQADLEFAGENLIEQPFEVAQVNIPFAKIAKKMDVRKLKRVMWDLLFPSPEGLEITTLESPSPVPSETKVHLGFSDLYGELPVRVSSKMANDLSQPIAFVTLLHLANEKNLKLIPNQDLKDFVIEDDGMN